MKSFCQLFVFLTVLFFQSSLVFSMDGPGSWGKERNTKDERAEDDFDWDEVFADIDLANPFGEVPIPQTFTPGDVTLDMPPGAMDVPASSLFFLGDSSDSGPGLGSGEGSLMPMAFPLGRAVQPLYLPPYQAAPVLNTERIEGNENDYSILVQAIRTGDPVSVMRLLENQVSVTRLDDLLDLLLKGTEMNLESRVLMAQLLLDCTTDRLPMETVQAGVNVANFARLLSNLISFFQKKGYTESRLGHLSYLVTRELIELAIDKDNPEIVAFLMRCLREVREGGLRLTLDLNGVGRDGTTLLYRALATRNLSMFRALLESHFIFYSVCDRGRWLYDIAEAQGLTEISVYLKARSVDHIIALAHKRIHDAIESSNVDCLLHVLAYCDSFRRRGGCFFLEIGTGDRLIRVLQMGNLEALKRFVELVESFDINRRYGGGMTLLHFAYKCGFDDIASYLIKAGANPMIQDDYGVMPIDYTLESLFSE